VILSVIVLALVTLQRGFELVLARRNTARLKARGAVEVGAAHYPLIVLMHAAWLAGLWLLAWNRPVNPWWLALFVVLQAGRLWVLIALGPRWTTRIIILPGAPLVRRGPYRYFSHPNYMVVAGEILVLPLTFGLVTFGLMFSVLNACVLFIRIRTEQVALAGGDLAASSSR
jgi:methyltransferase